MVAPADQAQWKMTNVGDVESLVTGPQIAAPNLQMNSVEGVDLQVESSAVVIEVTVALEAHIVLVS